MDAPLLALTRGRRDAPQGPSVESADAENLRQLIQLRWIAVIGQTATILLTHFGLGIRIPLAEMLGVALLLAIANLISTMALPRHRVGSSEIVAALLIDMAALTLQLYFSGGATNPFISLFLLQVVLGAILLPPSRTAILLAAAAASYALLSTSYLPLDLPESLSDRSATLFVIGDWIGFVMVAWLLVSFMTRISRNLRAHEAYLADLRQHAAEEEGIVRMGLFASGAAHELGTPLGSIAVILADWHRVPAVAADPDLITDVREMQAEVQRCKAIVSDILHSAGEPRGEAMEGTTAAIFLDRLVTAWRQTRPLVLLDYDRPDLGTSVIAAEPALRQAIGSLLDNAAEVSPAEIGLRVRIVDEMLSIAVLDRGPGFAPKQLVTLGKLYQSSKGAGHGLGLFLAANVARRLGGQIEARNRDEGGAEVRLLLPIANSGGKA